MEHYEEQRKLLKFKDDVIWKLSQELKKKYDFYQEEFDKETRHVSEDLTTLPGLLHAARSALRVREGGIVVGGLPCKTFVFMARISARMRSLSVVSVLFCFSFALLP